MTASAKGHEQKVGAVVETILSGGYDRSAIEDQLKALDQPSEIEDVDISPRGVSVEGGQFSAEGVVYIQLGAFGEELPISFKGHFSKKGDAVVDSTTVDTSQLFRSSFRPS